MKKTLIVFAFFAAAFSLQGASRTPAPLPPSAVLFDGTYSFAIPGRTYSAPVSVPVDGAWLTANGVWNNSPYPYWDCSHSYTGTLSPNANDYTPLFIAGWDAQSICSNQYPVYGCLNCGVDWGGQKAFPGLYMTTNNTPGFMFSGTGVVTLTSNNGGGQSDILSMHVEQVNRNAMVNLTMYSRRMKMIRLRRLRLKSPIGISSPTAPTAFRSCQSFTTEWTAVVTTGSTLRVPESSGLRVGIAALPHRLPRKTSRLRDFTEIRFSLCPSRSCLLARTRSR